MKLIINYGGRKIELVYSNYLDKIDNNKIVKAVGRSLTGDCKVAEEIAWCYLLRNASLTKPHRNLEKVIIIENNISSGDTPQEIKISLKGIPLFESIR